MTISAKVFDMRVNNDPNGKSGRQKAAGKKPAAKKIGRQKTGRQKPAACHQNGRYNQHNG